MTVKTSYSATQEGLVAAELAIELDACGRQKDAIVEVLQCI